MYVEKTFNLFSKFDFDFNSIETKVIDLVEIMSHVYFTDIFTPRTTSTNLAITIPVYNKEFWDEQTHLIETLLKWVSEEIFKLTFESKTFESNNFNYQLHLPNFNEASLFSGGLDSLAGAYYNYVNNNKSDYIGFVNKDEEGTKQRGISEFYKKIFQENSEIIILDKPSGIKRHYIQSTRSLLYMSLAIFKAHINGTYRAYLFENGVLSLNPEIANRYTTKTTHPKTIFLFNEILKNIDRKFVVITPFVFKTKGEIINEMNQDFKLQIQNTFTCGQSRTHPARAHKGQCGICIPCLLRKISISAFENETFDSNYQYDYNAKFKDISETIYKKDYESNYEYFRVYAEKIEDNTIFHELEIREKYYDFDSDFYNRTLQMLRNFSKEFERFDKKYAPY